MKRFSTLILLLAFTLVTGQVSALKTDLVLPEQSENTPEYIVTLSDADENIGDDSDPCSEQPFDNNILAQLISKADYLFCHNDLISNDHPSTFSIRAPPR